MTDRDPQIPCSVPTPNQTPQRYDGPLPSGQSQPVPGNPNEHRPAPPVKQA
jgi:hypothetical protein